MNETQELVFYDRYTKSLKTEGIYGEKPLRWAYETTPGRICLNAVIRRKWFSRLYGRWADCSCSQKEIGSFIKRFDVDTSEFLDSPESFSTFNEFFFRKLKPEARPIDPGTDSVVFPADGRHFLIPDLSKATTLYAKGQRFDLATLLGKSDLAEEFSGGTAVLSRLCPTDYHRYHFPLDGTPEEGLLINGSLFSVNPIALSRQLSYITENKRQITPVNDSPVGKYLFLEIGATNVGSIVSTSVSGSPVSKGDEKGYFRFGGSMVITIFPEGRFSPDPDFIAQSENGIELYARMGDRMGTTKAQA
ncbi:phosphatidylserine decarboxylase [Verrucomicrobiales bacterium BCK34]|nr:phosphatidylserine decarboxylase [Verrucomicrobiales bacterium BCK34]